MPISIDLIKKSLSISQFIKNLVRVPNIEQSIENIIDELINFRRIFHQNPELSFDEYNTADFIKKKLDETDAELLELSVVELRQRFNSLCKEMYVPFSIKTEEGVKVHIPKLGDKKKIVAKVAPLPSIFYNDGRQLLPSTQNHRDP